jgi:hypothetical protein
LDPGAAKTIASAATGSPPALVYYREGLLPVPVPATGEFMSVLRRADDHQWSAQHLSHYVEGDLSPGASRRLDRHAGQCVECGRGLRAVRAMLRALAGTAADGVRAPTGILDRARAAAAGPRDGAGSAPAPGA